MRITIVTVSYHPDRIGIAPVADDLSRGLHERGHQVAVIAGLPHYPEWKVPPDFRRHPFRREIRHGGVAVWRSYLYASPRQTVFARSAFYGTFTASASLNLLRSGAADAVVVISPPPTVTAAASLFRRLHGAAVVLNVQDIVPDAAIAFGLMKNSLQIKFFRSLERYAYSSSDHIVVVAESFLANLMAKGVGQDKMTVIHNWIDTDEVRPLERVNSFRSDNGIAEEDFVVMYAGNIGLSQGLDVVLEAAQRLGDIPRLLFVFVGGGGSLDALQTKARTIGARNVRFIPTQPEMKWVQAAADVSLVMQKPNVLDVNLPSKIPAIMASGRPMIAGVNPLSDAANIVRQSGAGILIAPGDADALSLAVRTLHDSSVLRRECGEKGRAYAVANFSRAKGLDAYESVIARTVAKVKPTSNVLR